MLISYTTTSSYNNSAWERVNDHFSQCCIHSVCQQLICHNFMLQAQIGTFWGAALFTARTIFCTHVDIHTIHNISCVFKAPEHTICRDSTSTSQYCCPSSNIATKAREEYTYLCATHAMGYAVLLQPFDNMSFMQMKETTTEITFQSTMQWTRGRAQTSIVLTLVDTTVNFSALTQLALSQGSSGTAPNASWSA